MKMYAVLLDSETNELLIVPSHMKVAVVTEEELNSASTERDLLVMDMTHVILRVVNDKKELEAISNKMGTHVSEVLVPICSCVDEEHIVH